MLSDQHTVSVACAKERIVAIFFSFATGDDVKLPALTRKLINVPTTFLESSGIPGGRCNHYTTVAAGDRNTRWAL